MFATRKPGMKWYDRGDPSAVDFDHNGLTHDNAWHDIDFSAIVPAGTKIVKLRIIIADTVPGTAIKFRCKGNTNTFNVDYAVVQALGALFPANIEVWVDSNRIAEYLISSPPMQSILITVFSYGK
jgi:hypothetical protein